MDEFKRCRQCNKVKEFMRDFYLCGRFWRTECKMCTIKNNGDYQRKKRARNHNLRDDAHRLYMRTYYNNNKPRFAKYRADFRDRHPNYHRDYFRRRKEKDG